MALLLALLSGCATRSSPPELSPEIARYEGRPIARLHITGDLQLPEDSLRAIVKTRATRCRFLGLLPACPLGLGRDVARLNLTTLAQDMARLELAYQDWGFYGTEIVPRVEAVGEERVAVQLRIDAGPRISLRQLSIDGIGRALPASEARARLPLRDGGLFRRAEFLASADTLRALLQRRGYAYAHIAHEHEIDLATQSAVARLAADPGPLVRVDTVMIIGADRIGEGVVRRVLPLGPGDVLRRPVLRQVEEQLLRLGAVSRAAVEITPASAPPDVDTVSAAVVVRITEAPKYLTGVAVGYGSVECVHAQARRIDRSFAGGVRRLEASASVAKLGVAKPLSAGLEEHLCRELKDDPHRDRLDYSVAVELAQPWAPEVTDEIRATLYARRFSELSAFQRETVGGGIAWVRGVSDRVRITAGAEAERGSTRAHPVIFCLGFEACDAEAVQALRQPRWSNRLRLEAAHHLPIAPEGGARLGGRVAAEWAGALLGSDDRYLRLQGEGYASRGLRPGWVLAGRLGAGTFVQPEHGFIPPERRFYLGGPFTVRGYEQNRLGPWAYAVRVRPGNPVREDTLGSPTGGTSVVVGTVELQIASSEDLRWAAFVDAGQVWARDPALVDSPLRLTPGAGVRYRTGVGLLRVDLAWNPYGLAGGPLYRAEADGEPLRVLEPRFTPPDGLGFWDRFKIHLALGNVF